MTTVHIGVAVVVQSNPGTGPAGSCHNATAAPAIAYTAIGWSGPSAPT